MVFSDRSWVSDARWPITAADIAPFYDRGFAILGMEQVMRDDAAVWERIGVNAPPRTDRIEPIFTRWTPESNLAIHFRQDIMDNPALTVLLDAQVGALVTEGDAVTGVEIRIAEKSGLRREILRGAKVVLANGTIEIARLLQLPTADGAPAPWATNPWIGRGFIDHVDCYAGSVKLTDRKRFADLFDNAFVDGLKYSPKLRLSDTAQQKAQLLEISSHFVFNSSIAENIANLKILIKGLMKGRVEKSGLANPLALLGTLRFIVPMALRYLRYRRMLNLSDAGIQLRLTSEQAPLADSRITLTATDRDAFDMPKVEVDWKISRDTVETLATFGEYIRDYLRDNGLAEVTLDATLVARDPAYLADTDDANHQMGGARMSASAQDGVVDADCAVFGTRNLYVAGAAVYPVSGFANPTFTAIALGLRLADHLAQEL